MCYKKKKAYVNAKFSQIFKKISYDHPRQNWYNNKSLFYPREIIIKISIITVKWIIIHEWKLTEIQILYQYTALLLLLYCFFYKNEHYS